MKDNDVFIDLSPKGAKYAICTDWYQAILSTSEPFVYDVSDPFERDRLTKKKEAIEKSPIVMNGDMDEFYGTTPVDPELIPDEKPKKLFVPLEQYSFFDG